MWPWLLILCIALPLCARFLPGLCVYMWLLLKGRAREVEDLRLEIQDLKQQQSEVSMVDEFAKHAKLSRKMNTKTKTMKELQQNQMWIRMKAYWYSKIGVAVLSFILFLVFRYEPVMVFDITPIIDYKLVYIVGYLLSFPTGIPGAVGMPVALFVCHRSINQILNFVIPDKSKQTLKDEPVE